MGGNGSYANGTTTSEVGREYKTVGKIGDNIVIVQKKNPNAGAKLPEESHTPGRIYAVIEKDGSDVKGFAKYGDDGKKLWEVHTAVHKGLSPHYHTWEDGHPSKNAYPLTDEMNELLDKIRKFKP